MKKCNKSVFVLSLDKDKPCYRKLKHFGRCSPDLTGEYFGISKALRPAKDDKTGGYNSWFVAWNGFIRKIRTGDLVNGHHTGSLNIGLGFSRKDGKSRPEWSTVHNHHVWIFNRKKADKNYVGMPFYDEWNPDKGGGYWRGVKWILENLGEKPSPDWSMDVIEHEKGFVPGNLRWAKRPQQIKNKRHKRLGLFTLQELKVEAKRHGYELVKKDAINN